MPIARFTCHVSRFTTLLLLVAVSRGAAQDAWDPSRVYASRTGLDSLARRFELSAESPAYSDLLRTEARREAQTLRRRLEEGDFQVGDRIMLVVEGEEALSDSFTVEQGPAVRLPTAGRVSLTGILRSEVEEHLARELANYIRNPDVRARTTIRITVTGEVGQPGFYSVGSDLLVTDVLAQAGQFTGSANLGEIRIERANTVLWDAEALGPEIVEGRTLDQLGVRAGDRVVVGGRSSGLSGSESSLRSIIYLVGLPGAILGLISLFTR